MAEIRIRPEQAAKLLELRAQVDQAEAVVRECQNVLNAACAVALAGLVEDGAEVHDVSPHGIVIYRLEGD